MAATGLLGINPYRKGVALDISSKPTALYVDMQQKERARQDALDKYFMEYDKNINPAGMRNQDIDDLTKLNLEGKQFYFQNKKAIQNPMLDGGKAYSKFINYNKEQLALIAASKQEAATAKAFQKVASSVKTKGDAIHEKTFQEFAISQKRIKDPEYRPFDMANFMAYTPFSGNKFREELYGKNLENFTSTIEEPFKVGDTEMKRIVKVFNPNPKNLAVFETLVKSRLEKGAQTNDGFYMYINEVQNRPEELKKINESFKAIYNRDINVQSKDDIAVGLALSLAPYDLDQKRVGETAESKLRRSFSIMTARGRLASSNFDVDKLIEDDYASSNPLPNEDVEKLNFMKSTNPKLQSLTLIGLKDVKGSIPVDLAQEYFNPNGQFRNPTYVLMDAGFNLHFIKDFGNGDVRYMRKPLTTYKQDYIKKVKNQSTKSTTPEEKAQIPGF